MSQKSPTTIFFGTMTNYVLWKYEILGQISDGMWENTRPYNHYKYWLYTNADFDPNSDDIGYVERNKSRETADCWKNNYNFTNPTLLHVIGDRMISKCIMAMVLESLEIDIRDDEKVRDYMSACNLITNSNIRSYNDFVEAINSYEYYKKYEFIDEKVINRFIALRDSDAYNEKDLRNDLRNMKKLISSIDKF